MEELWKPLYSYKGYEISNLGVIRSTDRYISIYRNGITHFCFREGKPLSKRFSKTNPHIFTSIQFCDENDVSINKTIYLHRAVADHFVKKPKHIVLAEKEGKKVYSSHIVKDYENNTYTNIRWITHKELMNSQPQRLRNPKKAWETRRERYGNGGFNKALKDKRNES